MAMPHDSDIRHQTDDDAHLRARFDELVQRWSNIPEGSDIREALQKALSETAHSDHEGSMGFVGFVGLVALHTAADWLCTPDGLGAKCFSVAEWETRKDSTTVTLGVYHWRALSDRDILVAAVNTLVHGETVDQYGELFCDLVVMLHQIHARRPVVYLDKTLGYSVTCAPVGMARMDLSLEEMSTLRAKLVDLLNTGSLKRPTEKQVYNRLQKMLHPSTAGCDKQVRQIVRSRESLRLVWRGARGQQRTAQEWMSIGRSVFFVLDAYRSMSAFWEHWVRCKGCLWPWLPRLLENPALLLGVMLQPMSTAYRPDMLPWTRDNARQFLHELPPHLQPLNVQLEAGKLWLPRSNEGRASGTILAQCGQLTPELLHVITTKDGTLMPVAEFRCIDSKCMGQNPIGDYYTGKITLSDVLAHAMSATTGIATDARARVDAWLRVIDVCCHDPKNGYSERLPLPADLCTICDAESWNREEAAVVHLHRLCDKDQLEHNVVMGAGVCTTTDAQKTLASGFFQMNPLARHLVVALGLQRALTRGTAWSDAGPAFAQLEGLWTLMRSSDPRAELTNDALVPMLLRCWGRELTSRALAVLVIRAGSGRATAGAESVLRQAMVPYFTSAFPELVEDCQGGWRAVISLSLLYKRECIITGAPCMDLLNTPVTEWFAKVEQLVRRFQLQGCQYERVFWDNENSFLRQLMEQVCYQLDNGAKSVIVGAAPTGFTVIRARDQYITAIPGRERQCVEFAIQRADQHSYQAHRGGTVVFSVVRDTTMGTCTVSAKTFKIPGRRARDVVEVARSMFQCYTPTNGLALELSAPLDPQPRKDQTEPAARLQRALDELERRLPGVEPGQREQHHKVIAMLRTLLQFECSSLPVDCLAPFLSVMNSQRFSPRWPHDGVLRPVAGNTGLQGQTIPFFVEGDAAPGEQGPPPYHSLVVHPDDSPLPDMLPYDEEDAACKGLNVADVFVGEEKPAAQFLMRLQSSRDVWDTVRQYYVADDPRATKELFWCAYRLGHKVGVPESTMRLLAWALVVVDQNNGYPPRERSFFQPCVQPGTLFVPTDIESICTQCVDGSINPITCCMRCGRALKKESPDNLGPECRRKRKHAETE